MDLDFRLVVCVGRERLRLLRRDRRVPRNHRGSHTTRRLNRQRQRSDIEQAGPSLRPSPDNHSLDRSAIATTSSGFTSLMWFLPKQLLHQLLDLRHTCLTADKHYLVDLRSIDASILQRLFARPNRPLQQVIHQRLQLCARQIANQVLRSARVCRDEGEIDLRLLRRRKFDLRLLRRTPSRRCKAISLPFA